MAVLSPLLSFEDSQGPPQNGSVHFNHEGTECDPVIAAYFSCDEGFNLSGNSVKKFQINNQWTGPVPVCEGLYSTCSINCNTAINTYYPVRACAE